MVLMVRKRSDTMLAWRIPTDMKIAEAPDILRVDDLQRLLRISRGAAYDLVRRNVIASIRIGRRVRVPKSNLLRFLQATNDGQDQS